MNQLILKGRLTKLEPVNSPDRRKRWKATLQVSEVDSGTFNAETFSFLVHSPVKSGLGIGGLYTLKAEPTPDGGYSVDESQWLAKATHAAE